MTELYFNFDKRVESCGKEYFRLMEEFSNTGDINLFSELYNKLLELEDEIRDTLDQDGSYVLLQDIGRICNAIDLLPYST